MAGSPSALFGAAPATAASSSVAADAPLRMSHTWTEAGTLGMKLKQRGETKEEVKGVFVSDLTNTALPGELKGAGGV